MRLLLLALLLPLSALADITATAQAPTTNTDGSTIAAGTLTNFTWYYGICGGSESSATTPINQPQFSFATPTAGEYCVQVTVTNTSGRESARSSIGTATIDPPTPNPPTLVTVETVAYEIKVKGNGEVMVGRAIGTVPLGTQCSTAFRIGDYYQIPQSAVTVSKPKVFSNIFVARCA